MPLASSPASDSPQRFRSCADRTPFYKQLQAGVRKLTTLITLGWYSTRACCCISETTAFVTPERPSSALSTAAQHAEHVMPPTCGSMLPH